jgi:hypothetical protein
MKGVPPIVHEVLRSPGRPLDAGTRAFFEPRLGADLGDVRIHTDYRADQSARAIHALAYTVGSNVVFAGQQYSPAETSGKRLLGHELTHVLQQRQVPHANASPQTLGEPDTPQEREADRVAAIMTRQDGIHFGEIGPAQLSVQRACAGDIGRPTGCTGVSGDIVGDHFVFKVSCDDFRKPPEYSSDEERRLRLFAATVSTGDTVDIHGFASEEGNPTFNNDLSCARAIKAQSVLAAEFAMAGKTVSSSLFQHGATAGNKAERRSVYIDWQPASPAPAAVTPAPTGTSGPTCTARTGTTEYGCYCGAGSSCTAGLTCPPLDALDACCQAHDACYDACPGCTFPDSINPMSGLHGAARTCDAALCACVAGLTLTGRAATYRGRMQTLFGC